MSHAFFNSQFKKKVKVVFLPANYTSVLQLLDLGLIRSAKGNYRELLMRKIIASLDKNVEKRAKANVLDVLNAVRESWDQVSISTIEKHFQKALLPGSQTKSDENDDLSFHFLKKSKGKKLILG